jgi:mannitol/fructose-specific phosphotransferase system IIA component (Ntr-type)
MNGFKEVVQKCVVCLNMTETNGMDVIARLVQEAIRHGLMSPEHEEDAVRAILNREQSASTAQPEGIALPHGRVPYVSDLVFMLGVHPVGVDFGAPDGRPTHLFAQMLAPQSCGASYIQFLAQLCQRLLDSSVLEQLMCAATREEICAALTKDGEKYGKKI